MDRNGYNENSHNCGNCAHAIASIDYDEDDEPYESWLCTCDAEPMPEPIAIKGRFDDLSDEEQDQVIENEEGWEAWEEDNLILPWGTCSKWKEIPSVLVDLFGLN